jgi:hypothetical protein
MGVDPLRDGIALYTGNAGVDDLDMIALSPRAGYSSVAILPWCYSLEIEMAVLAIEGARYCKTGQVLIQPCQPLLFNAGSRKEDHEILTDLQRYTAKCLASPLSNLGPREEAETLACCHYDHVADYRDF